MTETIFPRCLLSRKVEIPNSKTIIDQFLHTNKKNTLNISIVIWFLIKIRTLVCRSQWGSLWLRPFPANVHTLFCMNMIDSLLLLKYFPVMVLSRVFASETHLARPHVYRPGTASVILLARRISFSANLDTVVTRSTKIIPAFYPLLIVVIKGQLVLIQMFLIDSRPLCQIKTSYGCYA